MKDGHNGSSPDESVDRREFIKKGLIYGGGFCLSTAMIKMLLDKGIAGPVMPQEILVPSSRGSGQEVMLKEARWGTQGPDDFVRCGLCPNKCNLAPDGRGICRTRLNKNGKLYTLAYGNPCSIAEDPMQKAPFYHFKPGTTTLSIAIAGCNFRCLNCQNWEISQKGPDETDNELLSPLQAVENAKALGVSAITFTYTDPAVLFEYVYDVFKVARAAGLATLLKSNGYINPEPLEELIPVTSGASIDVKGFTDKFYEEVCGGTLQPVLDTCELLKEKGVWLEIPNLVVPTFSDDMDMVRDMAKWMVESLGPDVPLHFMRFLPEYKLATLPLTSLMTLTKARNTALAEGLNYVYIGNVPGASIADTVCPKCGITVVERQGVEVIKNLMNSSVCPSCGEIIPGVWT